MILHIKALSVNQAWQGRRFKTKKYKDYEKECLLLLPEKKMIMGYVEISFLFYLKYFATQDTDNLLKPIIDILVKKGYIQDDRYIVRLRAEKIKSKEDKIRFIIRKFQLR